MDEAYKMSLFRRQIEPDEHDIRKAAIEDQMIADSEEREELRNRLCEALGWIHRKSVITKDSDRDIAVHPFDANLIQAAKTKLLTTDELRQRYVYHLAEQTLLKYTVNEWPLWALTQSTEVQQARPLLEAIK